MLLHQAQQYLDSFINYEAKLQLAIPERFNLKRVELLLEAVGSPHKKLNCVQVAGSNGKGSVCAFTASILQRLGYKVGLYTSPHLWRLNERIRVLDSSQQFQKSPGLSGQITEDELCEIIEDIKPSIEKIRQRKDLGDLTFFEIITVIAFCYFYQQEVDFVVLETGLGGRLDATNVAQGIVCALTPISLEHTQQLGNTLAQIAKEKVAVVKTSQQKVVVAPQPAEVMQVIEEHCAKLEIKPVIVEKDSRYRSPLLGEYQDINAAMAAMTVKLLLDSTTADEEKIKEGIKNVYWPGRFEIIRKQPAIILDGAHNPGAAHELVKTVKQNFGSKKVTLICGMSSDKDKAAVAKELNQIAARVILTRSQHARAAAAEELQKLFSGKEVYMTHTVPEAVELALQKTAKEEVIIIAGSLFVAAEAKKYIG